MNCIPHYFSACLFFLNNHASATKWNKPLHRGFSGRMEGCLSLPRLSKQTTTAWWLKQQKSIFYISGGWKSKIKVSAGFFSREPLLSLQLAESCLLVQVLTWPVLCKSTSVLRREGERGAEVLSGILPHKDATAFGSGPRLYATLLP